jgi:hypothetical protein
MSSDVHHEKEVKTDLRKHNGSGHVIWYIRDGDADLVHITVHVANFASSTGYVLLYINHPLPECLKGHFIFQNLLRDQAFLEVQGTTLQLGNLEGATYVPTSLSHRNL